MTSPPSVLSCLIQQKICFLNPFEGVFIDIWLLIMKISSSLSYHVPFYRNLFLHNDHVLTSVPVGYTAYMKETYGNIWTGCASSTYGTVVEAHLVYLAQLEYLWQPKSNSSAA